METINRILYVICATATALTALLMAAPGVTLKQTDQLTLEVGIGKAAGNAISMGLLGIKYEPTATQTSLLVNEVRGLRKVIERATNK